MEEGRSGRGHAVTFEEAKARAKMHALGAFPLSASLVE